MERHTAGVPQAPHPLLPPPSFAPVTTKPQHAPTTKSGERPPPQSACLSVPSVIPRKPGTVPTPLPHVGGMNIKQLQKLPDFIGKKSLSLNSAPLLNLGSSVY